MRDVEKRVGLSRSSIYALAKLGQFPQWIKLGGVRSAWVAHEVDAWISERIAAHRTQPGTLVA